MWLRMRRLPTTEAIQDDAPAESPRAPAADATVTTVAEPAVDGLVRGAAGDAETLPDDEPERGPLRRCIITREQGERERMVRFVIGPERRVVPDLAARLPGRGIWLSARADVVENAKLRGAFARAARGPVTVPADLLALLQAGLAGRVGDFVGFARRAGEAVAGFTKAREWLVSGRAVLVLEASDGSVDERARLLSGIRWAMMGDPPGEDLPAVRTEDEAAGEAGRDAGHPSRRGFRARAVRVATPLDAARLGAVFGRDHVVHVAVAAGRLAEMLAIETERLSGIAGRNGTGA
jgi:predicted RNA-binding protein YlxR (DUF448 family)